MQVEGPDEGGQQQSALGRVGVHGMKIAARTVRDHDLFGMNWTIDGVNELKLGFAETELPGVTAKRVVVE